MTLGGEELLVLGVIIGAAGVLIMAGLYRLCIAMLTANFERRAVKFLEEEQQRNIDDTIQQLEDHANLH